MTTDVGSAGPVKFDNIIASTAYPPYPLNPTSSSSFVTDDEYRWAFNGFWDTTDLKNVTAHCDSTSTCELSFRVLTATEKTYVIVADDFVYKGDKNTAKTVNITGKMAAFWDAYQADNSNPDISTLHGVNVEVCPDVTAQRIYNDDTTDECVVQGTHSTNDADCVMVSILDLACNLSDHHCIIDEVSDGVWD